jgi:hypothetical protein
MEQNIFAIAIQHLTLEQAAKLAAAHSELRDTEPCDEAVPSSKTEYDVGPTIPSEPMQRTTTVILPRRA